MMRNNHHSQTRDAAMTSTLAALRRKISVVAAREPEDAEMTGMTRSLDRRLLALNVPRSGTLQRSAASPT